MTARNPYKRQKMVKEFVQECATAVYLLIDNRLHEAGDVLEALTARVRREADRKERMA